MAKATNRQHAIVIGGSIGGLFTARILSEYFEKVTIFERDPVHDEPESRKGQPQTRHLHGVFAPTREFIETHLPQVYDNLIDGGALEEDLGQAVHWYHFGGYSCAGEVGIRAISLSRPFMEYEVRKAVSAIDNIEFSAETSVDTLVMDDSNTTVIGVQVTYRAMDNKQQVIDADLVVDVSGRGSPMPKWLEKAGYSAPEEEHVKINVGYATRTYKRTGQYRDNPKAFMTQAIPPYQTRTTFMFPIEGDRWIVTASGYQGDYPPSDPDEFVEFVRSIATDDIYNIISNEEPLSDVVTHRFPSSRRRRYEKLDRFPNNLLVLGDAAASFNPIYGQGMSSASLQINALQVMLEQNTGTLSPKQFFQQTAKIIDLPWQVAVVEDFRYPQTEGKKPFGTDLINAYMAKVHQATHSDLVVYRQFGKVLNLVAHPMSLMKPNIMWRVLRTMMNKQPEAQREPIVQPVST